MGLNLLGKIRRSLRQHGPGATVALVAKNTLLLINSLTPWERRRQRRLGEFDRRFGLETAELVSRTNLDVSEEVMDAINPYEPSPVEGFNEIVKKLGVDFPEYTFIDLGSGKGRTLLLASEFPFRRIVGVEISRELTSVAARNVEAYRSTTQRCRDIRCVCADAREFEFPPEPLVVYLFNPFPQEVLTAVLAALGRSIREAPRDVVVVYAHPIHAARYLDGVAWLRAMAEGSFFNEYHHETDRYVIYGVDREALWR